MCGIAGIISRRGRPPSGALAAMERSLLHRGPDSQGQHHDENVSLIHTRLSIIDLSGGQQPLFGADGRHCLIANGEIYNYADVRERLLKEGHSFKTHSDCEVILPLYERYGRNCVEHMRGMFGFALWDNAKRHLLLGRDRMGEKPIYYALSDDYFLFASELRTIMESGLVKRELDARQVARYFRYQYVPDPDTPFLGVQKLPAGSTLEFDVDGWSMDLRRYWSAWNCDPIEGDPKRLIRDALEDAVSTSLISDVPIGVSLSGGIDSSILACLMVANNDKPMHAISIGYPDASGVNERPEARRLAERLGIAFHDVELSDEDMISCFRTVVNSRDDPIGDISGHNYFSIMRHARAHGIKVMLQGHGLDELCWGYPWVRDAVAINEGRWPSPAGSGSGSLRKRAATALWRWRELARSGRAAQFRMFELQPYTQFVDSNADKLFTPAFRKRSGWGNIGPDTEYGTSVERTDLKVTRLITDFYLLQNGIAQGDRLSMANSVEVRLPFVDHKLVETIIGLRKTARDDHLPLKHWLKESVRDLIGDEIIDRPKRGFSPPGARWHRALRENFGAELTDGFLVENGILDGAFARRLASPAISDPAEAIVSRLAIILETWARGVVSGAQAGGGAVLSGAAVP